MDRLLEGGVFEHNTAGSMTGCMDIQLYGYMVVWRYGQGSTCKAGCSPPPRAASSRRQKGSTGQAGQGALHPHCTLLHYTVLHCTTRNCSQSTGARGCGHLAAYMSNRCLLLTLHIYQWSAVQCSTVNGRVVQINAVLCSAVGYSTVQCPFSLDV